MATSVTLKPNAIDISGSTSGTTTLQASAVAGTTTLTLPAATDTLVGKATTDTLTNKTLTGAAMNGTLGATTPSTASVTTLTTSSTVTHSGGTANGVAYLDGSKVLTTGSALVFDGTNLGLGVTPSAWGSSYKSLDIVSNGGSFGASSYSPFVSCNAYHNGTNWIYKGGTYGASVYSQFNGAHIWNIAASGTAGNAITFTQAMTLDASGNLGVGTTSPDTKLNTEGGTLRVSGTRTAGSFLDIGPDNTGSNGVSLGVSYYGSGSYGPMKFSTGGSERARIESSGNFIQKGATTASGIKPSAIGNSEGITTVNSTTYTVTLGTSAKLFWISLGNGDAALVFTSYLSSSITFLGITPTNIVASASPTSAQLGISKSANSHDIVIKTGSALASTAAAWQMGVLSSGVS